MQKKPFRQGTAAALVIEIIDIANDMTHFQDVQWV